MITVLLTLVVLVFAVLFMAVGVFFGRSVPSPGCGWTEGSPLGGSCDCERRCGGFYRRRSR